MMRAEIVIHASGNSRIGIGNLSRSFELVKHLAGKLKAVAVLECDKALYSRFQSANTIRSDDLESSLEVIQGTRCRVYLSDLIAPDRALHDRLKRMGVETIMHFNGLASGFDPDVLFVTDNFDYPVSREDTKIYRGFDYYVISQEVVQQRPKQLVPLDTVRSILVCFGGADPAGYTEDFTEQIIDHQHHYSIVLGPAMERSRKDAIRSIARENVQYLDAPRTLSGLLLSHDLLVTLGGVTTYEAMCLGVPASAVRWSYLTDVVKSFDRLEMVIDLGEIDQAYQNLLDLDVRQLNEFCSNAYQMIDGSALQNIERVIRQYL